MQRTRRVVRVPVPEGEIACHVAGEGPTLVFLHSALMDSRMWTPQVAFFEDSYRTIAIDQRGHGESEVPSDAYDPAADAALALVALEVDRAAIVGIGEGADYALRLAAQREIETWALELAAPLIGWLVLEADPEGFVAGAEAGIDMVFGDPHFEAMVDAVERGDLAAIAKWIADDEHVLSTGHPAHELVLRMAEDNAEAAFRSELVLPPAADLSSRLKRLDLPTQVLSPGGESSDTQLAALAELLGDVNEVTFSTRAALLNLEMADAFNTTLRTFLSGADERLRGPSG